MHRVSSDALVECAGAGSRLPHEPLRAVCPAEALAGAVPEPTLPAAGSLALAIPAVLAAAGPWLAAAAEHLPLTVGLQLQQGPSRPHQQLSKEGCGSVCTLPVLPWSTL